MSAGVVAEVEGAGAELALMAVAVRMASPPWADPDADPPQLQAARFMAAAEPIIGRTTTKVLLYTAWRELAHV